MIDLLLCYVPKRNPYAPPLSLGLLKAIVEKNGYSCKIVDFNYDLYEKMGDIPDYSFFLRSQYMKIIPEIRGHIVKWVDEVIRINPKWVGVSVASQRCAKIALEFIQLIRKKTPHIKIMIGGTYLIDLGQKFKTTRDYLLEGDLVDVAIIGEAEISILDAFNSNEKIIQGKTPNLNEVPFADYSDLNINNYESIDVITSKGCINKCRYCDLSSSQRYKVRDGEITAKEILYNRDKYRISRYNFADNLINGSLKQLRKMFKILKGSGVSLEGQMFCDKRMTEDDFVLARDAGLTFLNVGVESGSEKIRKEMGKSFFSNMDLDKMFKFTNKYGITTKIQIIVGWPTETENDFQDTLNLIETLSKYNDTIDNVKGNPLMINEHMRVYNDFEFDWDKYQNWVFEDNNMKLRIDRYFRLKEKCENLGVEFDEFRLPFVLEEFKKYV